MPRERKTIGKYSILEQIEDSNYALIYRVNDSNNNTTILKLARVASPEYNELIAREFQVLSQFKHPNIVKVFDYNIAADGRAYFISEYIKGQPIHELFKGFSEDFLAVIMQVMNGLGAFHNQGLIHTDLKPEHILYDQEARRAVLIDFGFAGRATQDMKLAGTMGYIAPEVLKGIGIDQRSDLYSLGVIIYEILSGTSVPDKFEAIKDVPVELNNTLARLISREPAVRPSIPELYQTFSKYLPSYKIEIPTYEVALPETGFVELPEVVEQLKSAKGKALIITGDIGSGKTRLLKEMQYRYLMDGYSVLFHISKEKAKFYESLQNFIGVEGIDFKGREDKFQIYEEIMSKLLGFAKDKHVIIIVDDLESLSKYSLGLFRYIGYGIENTNILLVAAAKPDERVKKLGFETLPLKPFVENGTKTLLEKTFFAISSSRDIETSYIPDFARWLHKQSGGNPLFIVEILKTLYGDKILCYQAGSWQIKSDELAEVTIPGKLEDILAFRFKTLSEDELRLLKIIHLAGYPLETSIVSSISKSNINVNIEHLKSLGLLKEELTNGRRTVMIPNQILDQVIEVSLSDKERQLYSRQLIETIEKTAPEDRRYLPILADLSDSIGEKEKTYKYLQESAENTETMYDYDSALRYYEKITAYSKDLYPKRYSEFLVKLGDINQIIGNNESAINYYDEALKLASPMLSQKIYSGLGKVHSTLGEDEKVVEYCQTAMKAMKNKNSYYIETANLLGYTLARQSEFEKAESILNESLLLARKIKDRDVEAYTLYYQASLEWFRNDLDKGIKLAQNLLTFCEKHKLFERYAYCASLLNLLYQNKGNIALAQKYLDVAIDGFSKIKQVNLLCLAMHNSALLLKQQGKCPEARDLFKKTLIQAQKIDNKHFCFIALLGLAYFSEDYGRFEDAINLNQKALTIYPELIIPNYNLAMISYKKGELDKARALLNQKLKIKKDLLYYSGLALINSALGETGLAEEMLNTGLELVEKQNPDAETTVEMFLKTAQFYCEEGDFQRSLDFSKKILDMTNPQSKEFIVASAFQKINTFNLKKVSEIDITQEAGRLKEMGCIYDCAYLRKVRIESMINTDFRQQDIKTVAEELSSIQEIFESLGAGLELERTKKLQERLYPIIIRDYSRRIISTEYLQTFSRLAELISNNLGDDNFSQNILDLTIRTTNAERGALFVKTPKGMEFAAGRDMDQETIKDAGELSQTAIKQLEKNEIVFARDALSDPKFNIKKSVMLHQIRSLLCIPLSISGNVIGALYLDSRLAGGIFGPQDKDFLLTVSRILASVIEKSIAFRKMTEENILLKSNIIQEIGSGYLMGKSRVMKDVYKLIDSVSETNSPVLILGETGTGKGMVARLIHLKSNRRTKKFLTINCGTIPETLLESELFGHKKGAFTGAISDKRGLLEEAEAGTIFLDEISNTSVSFQAKLLEAIEEKVIRRVGETVTRNIDVRFFFATNKDLEIEVEDMRFRRDLFYRINVFKVEVPPLRERVNDIPQLAQFFLEKYNKELNKKIEGFTPEAMQRLREYFWPGNVRELQNVIERAFVLAKGKLITEKDI
ncbi:MAG: sigma 54-interacting transcriptional regulator, partial [candidate division WOR-3 bacterium]